MFRKVGILIAVFAALVVIVSTVAAGNAHFVGTPQLSASGNVATASGKVAGLGNIDQIQVTVSGDAACVNRGNKNPDADNKDTFSASGTFPVQNGKALFSLDLVGDVPAGLHPADAGGVVEPVGRRLGRWPGDPDLSLSEHRRTESPQR